MKSVVDSSDDGSAKTLVMTRPPVLSIPGKSTEVDSTHRPPMSGELEYVIVDSQPVSISRPAGQSNIAYGAHDEDGNKIKPGAIEFEGLGWIPAAERRKLKEKERKVQQSQEKHEDGGDPDMSEGLWITLTPTRMSSSPFVDTLLVLVVSPLVTLTVVYCQYFRSEVQLL